MRITVVLSPQESPCRVTDMEGSALATGTALDQAVVKKQALVLNMPFFFFHVQRINYLLAN